MNSSEIKDLFNRADLFARHNGMLITELKEGFARAEMEIMPYHLNAVKTIHGGALFTLADFAFAAASNSRGQIALSINSSISIFKGAKEGRVIAEAKEIHTSPKLASFEINIYNQNNELLATFQGMVYRKSALLESINNL